MSSEITKSRLQLLYGAGLVFVFWTVIGLSATIQTYIHYTVHSSEKRPGLTWLHLLLEILPPWYYWALITPLVIKICKRFPFERTQPLWLTFLIHLFISICLTLPYLAVAAVFYRIGLGLPVTLNGIWEQTFSSVVSRFNFALLTYWAILGFGFALDYYRRLRVRELQSAKMELELENQLVNARLDILKMQLNPHFLFNTLNGISAVMSHNIKGARRMITSLGELLRFNLDSSDQQTIPLKQEMTLLNLYFDIERERFKDKLAIEVSIQPESLDCQVPQFILQPLAENAVKHGIANVEAVGEIRISASKEDGYLLIQIEDNGAGFPKDLKHGIGLTNTGKRLEKLYGEDFEFLLKATKSGGSVVSIRIPAKPAKLEIQTDD